LILKINGGPPVVAKDRLPRLVRRRIETPVRIARNRDGGSTLAIAEEVAVLIGEIQADQRLVSGCSEFECRDDVPDELIIVVGPVLVLISPG
jgi:hypothetical protein